MANKIYQTRETAITFTDSSGDVAITLANLAAGVGRVSARYDQGAGSKPKLWTFQGVFQFESAPVVGETVEMWLFESNGTYAAAGVGTGDGAMTTEKRNNAKFIGALYVPATDTATNFITSPFAVLVNTRYFSVGVWNGSAGDNLKNTANANLIVATPIPDEIQ